MAGANISGTSFTLQASPNASPARPAFPLSAKKTAASRKNIMMGSVLPWNPEIRIDIGDSATIKSGARTRNMLHRRPSVPASANAHSARSRKRFPRIRNTCRTAGG